MNRFEELKKRKIVQWALAYLAGAFAALQLLDILAAQFGWPVGVERGLTVLLAFGLPVTLVLAWYHGEKGRQRVSGGEAVAADQGSATLEAEPAQVPVTSRSVAVLPLANQSPSEDHAWFAEAMTEEITTALSRVPELRVTSRSTAVEALRLYVDAGGRSARVIRRAPIFESVRADSAFAAELAELEREVGAGG